MKFYELVDNIETIHAQLQEHAVRSINNALTIRNIFIGFCIVEFEQHGEDRAKYGEALLKNISFRLRDKGLKGFSDRNLRQFRQFL